MDDETKRRIDQLREMSDLGLYGEKAKHEQARHAAMTPADAAIDSAKRFWSVPDDEDEQLVVKAQWNHAVLLLICYRDAKRRSPEVARALLHSMIEDYPSFPNTKLFPKLENLLAATNAYQQNIETGRGDATAYFPVREALLKLLVAYNEFLGALFGFMVPCVLVAKHGIVKRAYFDQTYGNLVQMLSDLTGGEEGLYASLIRLAQPKLRNAISHGDIDFTYETGVVTYSVKTTGEVIETDNEHLAGYALTGSHLPDTYCSTLATLNLYENGPQSLRNRLPAQIDKIMNMSPVTL